MATATDRSYLPYCATTILSALRATTGPTVVAHVIQMGDVPEGDQVAMQSMAEQNGGCVTWIRVNAADLGSLPSGVLAHGGAVSCARVLLPDLLPNVSRLIYLDADTYTTSSLEPLWSTNVDNFALAAVQNVLEPVARQRVADLGLPDWRHYLNSGVLLMNLDFMRRSGSVAAMLNRLRERGSEMVWVDQDLLNLVFKDAWLPLHPRWNAQNSFWAWQTWARETLGAKELAEATDNPGVLHFEGPSFSKPWHYLCPHPYRIPYRQLMLETPWGNQPLTDRTAATRLISLLPEDWRIPAYLRLLRVRARA